MTCALSQHYHRSQDFSVDFHVTDGWADNSFLLGDLTGQTTHTARQMLYNVHHDVLCGSIVKGGKVIASGFCVIERGYVGLLDIVVGSNCRGMGCGNELCASLLNEAQKHGAASAYLQVVQTNTPAVKLYGKLGFQKLYDYWYRVKA
jgi:ribosomal protein S18 acetylase RimI-like enzyme